MSRPAVLYLVHQFGNQTGVELHTRMLAEGLSDRYVVAIAWVTAEGLHLLQPGQALRTFPADPPVWPQTPYRAERTAQSLGEILRLVRPDVVHIQHFLNWPLGVIDQALDSEARVVVSFHDHFALSPLPVFQISDQAGETLTPAYSMKTFGQDISPWLRERRAILRQSLARVDALVAISPYLTRQLTTAFPAMDFREIEYGIVAYRPLAKSPASAGLRFGFLGQLVPIKGWESLVAGFAEVRRRHPAAELHLFGGDQPHPPPGVTFHGPYESRDLAGICSGLDVGVVPSIVAETYCMVLSEMWQGGLPVATSDMGALSDRVIDRVNGIKFQPGDPASIARALSWFVEHDEWREWRLPRPRLVPEMVADYDQLYQEILARPKLLVEGEAKLLDHAADELLIVQSCGFHDVGDGIYRLHSPSLALSRLKGITVIDCHPYHRRSPELLEAADVLILTSFDDDIFPLLERRRAAGRVTVLEANDYYFDPHPWNTAAGPWLNRSLEDWFCHLLTLVDGVQASTPELARRWRERTTRPVDVFRNQLADIPPLPPARSRPLTIGWGGSLGHLADWSQIAPGLQRWLDAHPEVHLAVMTNDDARSFVQLAPERYHFQTFGPLSEYLDFLDRIDIGLAPLLPTDFNRCRSDVKFLEYASRGVVGIYADLEPYHDSIQHGHTGFLYRTQDELFACLDALVADVQLRERVREAAYAEVAQHRRLENHISERLTFYRELLGTVRRPHQSDASSSRRTSISSLANVAASDGNYLQLRPQLPEQVLAAAMEGPSTRESAAALARLVPQYPNYLAAILQLGVIWNDLHDSTAALPYLERAHQLNPRATEPLCQLARLSHRQGDLRQAFRLLESAIEINPYSSRPWRYLLRLLPAIVAASLKAGGPPFDGRPWAERARRMHPASYSLALLGAHLYPLAEAISLLEQLLDRYVPQLRPDDVMAVALFSVTIETIAGPHLDQLSARVLARRAVTAFPQSVRLSDLLARALTAEGNTSAAHAEFFRGQQLRRAALCYRTEFPKEDENVARRQIAEHLLRLDDE